MLKLPEAVSDDQDHDFEELKRKYEDEDWLFERCRRDLIRRTFLETADATYITARWQFFNGLRFEFYWNALHAIEKYLKAVLLLNEHKANDLQHDIVKAFVRAQESFQQLLPNDPWPSVLTQRIESIVSGDPRWRLRHSGPKSYVEHLARQGGSDARYAMTSHVLYTTDLYCLDLTCFLIRRLSQDLRAPEEMKTLIESPDICPCRYSLLEDILSNKQHRLRSTLIECNYFLASEIDTTRRLNVGALGMSASNSVLYNHIAEKFKSSRPTNVAVSKRLAHWVSQNLPGVTKSFKAELEKYK